MRLLAALTALTLAGCAHGGGAGAGVRSRKHAPLKLVSVEGLSESQEPIVEGAICQGLVDGNGGDVSCPESTRQVLEVARMRALATSSTASADAVVDEVQKPSAEVVAAVKREGDAFVLTLKYRPGPGAPETATRTFKARSFEELVEGSTGEARALLE